jgi:hypothetical protein
MAVIVDLDDQLTVLFAHGDVGTRCAGMAGNVGKRLGDDEVGGRLDRGRVASVRDGDGYRLRRSLGERFDRGAKAGFGEDRRMDAAGEIPDLGDRRLEFGRRLVEEARRPGNGLLRQLETHRESDEALLRAVVEVALHASSLRIASFDDSCARRANLIQLSPHLRRQTLVLEGQPCSRPRRFDEARVLRSDLGIVDEDSEDLVVVLESGHGARVVV